MTKNLWISANSDFLNSAATCKTGLYRRWKSVILVGWLEPREKVAVIYCNQDYSIFRDELTIHNGILFKGNHVIIPEMLMKIHTSHIGIEISLRKAWNTFWNNMAKDIKYFKQNNRFWDNPSAPFLLHSHTLLTHPPTPHPKHSCYQKIYNGIALCLLDNDK